MELNIPCKDISQLDELTLMMKSFNWRNDLIETSRSLIESHTPEERQRGVQKLKDILCIAREQVYSIAEEVIKSGVVPYLIQFIQYDDEELQLAAAFCLTNVAAGSDEQTDFLVQSGTIEPLVKLLRYSSERLRRQALFCLANIAGSAPGHREKLINVPNYLNHILNAISNCTDQKLLEIAAWNLRNLSVLPGLSFEYRIPALEWFINNFDRNKNSGVLARHTVESLYSCAQSLRGLEMIGNHQSLINSLIHVAYRYPLSSTVRQVALEILHLYVTQGDLKEAQKFVASAGHELCLCLLEENSAPSQMKLLSANILAHLASTVDEPIQQTVFGSGGKLFSGLLSLWKQQQVEETDLREQVGIAVCRALVRDQKKLLMSVGLVCPVLEMMEFSLLRLTSGLSSRFPMTCIGLGPGEGSPLEVYLNALQTMLSVGSQLAQSSEADNPVKQSLVFYNAGNLLSHIQHTSGLAINQDVAKKAEQILTLLQS